jgi:hypothetical protein
MQTGKRKIQEEDLALAIVLWVFLLILSPDNLLIYSYVYVEVFFLKPRGFPSTAALYAVRMLDYVSKIYRNFDIISK